MDQKADQIRNYNAPSSLLLRAFRSSIGTDLGEGWWGEIQTVLCVVMRSPGPLESICLTASFLANGGGGNTTKSRLGDVCQGSLPSSGPHRVRRTALP